VKPGDLVVIPKGTAHGGTKPDAGSAPIRRSHSRRRRRPRRGTKCSPEGVRAHDPEKHVLDVIGDGNRFSGKIMRH